MVLEQAEVAVNRKRYTSVSDEFWSWFTGFWEGEGSLGVYQHKNHEASRSFKIQVSQKDLTALLHIQRILGGRIEKKTKQECHSWYICSKERIGEIISCMIPHARSRVQLLENVLDAIQKPTPERTWKKWLKEEDDFLFSHNDSMTVPQMASVLQRTDPSIRHRMLDVLQLQRKKRHG